MVLPAKVRALKGPLLGNPMNKAVGPWLHAEYACNYGNTRLATASPVRSLSACSEISDDKRML
jgi:hypothetical protein